MRRSLLLLPLGVLLLGGCDDSSRQDSPFNPEIGHPDNWVEEHGDAALSRGNTCPDCHGADLQGGPSQLSCFVAQYEGVACHEQGEESRHTTGWSLPSEHGRTAKDRPGISSGFAFCQACHGGDYGGGTSKVSCASCHGLRAPHPKPPWLRGRTSHHTVNEQNAEVCDDCHRSAASQEPPGCFNLSLCHGSEETHPSGWALADAHGAAAKEDPESGGFEECRACHGANFEGGTSGVSCASCHGIRAPHPLKGWEKGGEGHRTTGEKNAPLCAECHDEIGTPPDCFTANGCHEEDGGPASPPGDSPPPQEEGEPSPPPEGGGEEGQQ